MAVLVNAWELWQGKAFGDTLRKRKERGTSNEKPLSMGWMAVTTSFYRSERFLAFAEIIGRARDAEAFWLRLLQFVGREDAIGGTIRTRPEGWGPIVLTVELDLVDSATGLLVYEAVLLSHLCSPVPDMSGTRPGHGPVRSFSLSQADKSGTRPGPVRDVSGTSPGQEGGLGLAALLTLPGEMQRSLVRNRASRGIPVPEELRHHLDTPASPV